eukprot:746217-Rhodomonas_salina.1
MPSPSTGHRVARITGAIDGIPHLMVSRSIAAVVQTWRSSGRQEKEGSQKVRVNDPPKLYRAPLCQYRTSRSIRYIGTGHRVGREDLSAIFSARSRISASAW